MAVCNLLALDDFGGLQTLYVSLARALAHDGAAPITVNRALNGPLGGLVTSLAAADVAILSPKLGQSYRWGGALSRWPRLKTSFENAWLKRHMARVFDDLDIRRVVAWNALPADAYIPRGGDIVLYDHGLSSNQMPHSLNRDRVAKVSAVIAVSNANRRVLQERWGMSGNIHVLPNPLRSEIAGAPVRPRVWNGDRPLVIGAACRLVSFKGLASLVHAVATVRERGLGVVLRLAGSGPEQANLERAILSRDAGDFITFDGVVDDMPAFFDSIDLLVAPSIREPFGLTPLEALACGVPTIMSGVDGHPEVEPFPGAATLVTPDLALHRYAALGSSLKKMPQFVYSPERDCIVRPMALDPEKLADAIMAISQDYCHHADTAMRASGQVRQKNAMSTYAATYLALTGV